MIFNKELNRENVEWSNTWIDNARNFDCSRILLIGGSGAREFRSSLSKQLHGYAVDFIGTSSSLEDHLLYDICNMFLNNPDYAYSFILVNIGGKHGMYLKTADNEENRQQYQKAFSDFINFLLPYAAHIILITTPPSVQADNLKQLDETVNKEIRSRNAIQTLFGVQNNLPVIDLYDYTVKQKFKYRDTQHFANKKIQMNIASYIIRNAFPQNFQICSKFPYHLYRGGYATLEQYILKIKWLWGIFKITHNRKFTCYYIFGLRIKKNIRK